MTMSDSTTEHTVATEALIKAEGRTFKMVPCSCRCGGRYAWVELTERGDVMIGCVCHHAPVSAPDAPSMPDRLRAAADKSANEGREWYQLVHRCREAADEIERLEELVRRLA